MVGGKIKKRQKQCVVSIVSILFSQAREKGKDRYDGMAKKGVKEKLKKERRKKERCLSFTLWDFLYLFSFGP